MKQNTKDIYSRSWIIEKAVQIISRYRPGELTIRALHYQLVGEGMINTMQHYKRVVAAMEVSRWDNTIEFSAFSDLDRAMVGRTSADMTDVENGIEEAKEAIQSWMRYYSKNRWENQQNYAEVFIEKKALQNVFQGVCIDNAIALGAVKGYPSLTFLHEAAQRFITQADRGKNCIVLYFGDYDPSGEDIPRSIEENLNRMGANVEVRRFALFDWQVRKYNLPPAPAKETDSRTANWDGMGQVELDAVKPEELKRIAQEAIDSVFDYDLYYELEEQEREELTIYRAALKEYTNNL
jgi:hypothetical protein